MVFYSIPSLEIEKQELQLDLVTAFTIIQHST